jgi:CheY-like chemotaxis protein
MPEMGGREVHERVAADWPPLAARVVFMTGGAFTLEASDFLARTSSRVLAKPFAADELRALVRAEIQAQARDLDPN